MVGTRLSVRGLTIECSLGKMRERILGTITSPNGNEQKRISYLQISTDPLSDQFQKRFQTDTSIEKLDHFLDTEPRLFQR